MHFISQLRYNPNTGRDEKYYRIKETFRDQLGRVRSRILLNVGFLSGLRPEDIRDIGFGLTYMSEHRGEQNLFGNPLSHYSAIVREHMDKYWNEMIESGAVDTVARVLRETEKESRRYIDTGTMKHTDARDMGAEWACMQAMQQLRLEGFLRKEGWSDSMVKAALSLLATRTVYSSSELRSERIMRDNSAICELVYGERGLGPSHKTIYKVAPELYKIKEKLERHLCTVTDNLFNQQNRILLFDLTNFYFEGRKDGSKKASYGRSKEKRADCKLLVLALCINTDGFIRYSSVLEGKTSDPSSLPDMVENVIAATPLSGSPDKSLVVIDAGIATEDNLRLIREKGFNYLCVSRRRLTDYEIEDNAPTVTVRDCINQAISLTRVRHDEGGDYYLEILSPSKKVKEDSMKRQFATRFEQELQKAKDAIGKKGGVKKYEKVVERIGRAKEKYPSIARYYTVDYIRSEQDSALMSDIKWKKALPEEIEQSSGRYFLRTNVPSLDEKTTWDYYNLIREIECTNRQLKTDLSLRPIFHQKDERSDAHLFLGLLAYWVVNTIRLQLKKGGINDYWTEIVRKLSTQKIVTTEAINALGEKQHIRICSEPTKDAAEIYKLLRYKDRPFKRKICSTQPDLAKNGSTETQGDTT